MYHNDFNQIKAMNSTICYDFSQIKAMNFIIYQ